MLANGCHEALTSTFCSAADADLFAPQPAFAVAMGNPLNAEAGMLRPSLLPGLVTAIELNVNRNVEDVRIFEIGTVFSGSADRVDERPALGFAATGATAASGPHTASRIFDFYDAKGIVETLLDTFQYRSAYFDALLLPAWLHPGRGARCVMDGLTVGYFGQLHPAEAQKRKLKQLVFTAALYLDRLYALPSRQPRVQELSRYQPVSRDFSFTFPDAVRWEQIESSLHSLSLQDTMTFAPRELFRPRDSADKGEYSLLLSTTFQAPDRTLKEDEVQAWSKQVIDALEQLGGALRK
jgi:phenylalanyl-tRNA synthetase beta chain